MTRKNDNRRLRAGRARAATIIAAKEKARQLSPTGLACSKIAPLPGHASQNPTASGVGA